MWNVLSAADSAFALLLCWSFLWICPYSKVEESFNMQASHDIIYFRTNVSRYDHLQFPGVVPRTFVGALLLTFIPICVFPLLQMSKFSMQYTVRFLLGSVVTISFMGFASTARKCVVGRAAYRRFMWISLTQFHFFFYASRSLPNTLALIFVLLSLRELLERRDVNFIRFAGVAILIFRMELILFYGPLLICAIAVGQVRIRPTLFRSILFTGVCCLGGSILVDSFFWRRFVWPEGVVFYYNTILNKSIQWGSSPFHWYFSSALPRALLSTYAFSLMCAVYVLWSWVWNRSTRMCVIPTMVTGLMFTAFAFVFLYSWLPHKELRFIIYAIPLFNLAAGTAWAKLEQADIHIKVRSRSKWSVFIRKWAIFTLYAHLVVNISCTFLLLLAAKNNYPGGDALAKLNNWPGLCERPNVQIHICNLAAQTGVTRFLEEHPRWIYNKTEHIENDVQQLLASGFTHIISEIPAEQMSYLSSEFKLLFTVDAFSKIRVRPNLRLWRFVELLTAPSLAIYERKSNNTT